ncbi:putative RNA-binding protein ARP1 [Iris pallida]|uniref:RNA-binding protein ARP1 n=1 Tax=Iris pallida TaxID=29817 RepID=A0AAX6FEW9_IRIPA|nr:putative RNA-binding protein ARP1 [Iris pallida]
MASSSLSPQQYRSRFGDTTLTKVFVGGLAWETPTEDLRAYFDQFGEILEAVIITDKNTGRSKGYGFVTFREPDSARRSVLEPNPIIDGRRANCNIASLGRPRPSLARGRNQVGSIQEGPPQATGPQYSRVPAQMPPPPSQVMYPTPFGYMAYPSDYAYQQGVYNPQMASHYYNQMYGPTSSSTVAPQAYPYPYMGYAMQNLRAGFQSPMHAHRPTYAQYPPVHAESYAPSLPYNFQLQPPPQASHPVNNNTGISLISTFSGKFKTTLCLKKFV